MTKWLIMGMIFGGFVAVTEVEAQFVPPSSQGDENIEGFTVSGKASLLARPNRMEIDLNISSASELTADAIVKYRDAKRRVLDAFGDLQLEGVEVEERGLLVDQKGAVVNPYYIDSQANQRTKTEVQLSRKLVVRCDAIREMEEEDLLQLVARLLDVAQDAGGVVGPGQPNYDPYYYSPRMSTTNLVRFILDDYEALLEQAYEDAVSDARTRAGRLARLSGVELGPIVAIREVVVPGDGPPNRSNYMMSNEDPTKEGQLESPRFQDVPIRVELLVRFRVKGETDDVGEDERP